MDSKTITIKRLEDYVTLATQLTNADDEKRKIEDARTILGRDKLDVILFDDDLDFLRNP